MTIDELVITLGLDPTEVKNGLVTAQALLKTGLGNIETVAENTVAAVDQSVKETVTQTAQAVETGTKEMMDAAEQVADEGTKKIAQKSEANLNGGMRRILDMVRSFAGPILAAMGVSELFSSYVNGATALDRLSKSLGMDIERLQEWQGAARSAGVDAEEVGNIFRDMNDYITDAVRFDSGPLKEIAAQLGISLTDVSGAARNSEAVLLDLADAFQSVGSQEATGYGMQLSFDPGMIALLQQGRGALEDLFREQRELGIYTKQDAEIATRFNRELGDLWQSMKAGSAIIMRIIVPAMTVLIDGFQKAVDFLREHQKFVEFFFIAFAAAVTAYGLPALKKLAVAAATNPFTLLIAGAVALALVLEDLFVWMNGGEAALGRFWSLFGTPDEVKAKVEGFIETMKGLGALVLDFGGFALKTAGDLAPLIAGLYAAAAALKAIQIVKAIQGVLSLTSAMGKLKAAFSIGKLLASPFGFVTVAIVAIIGVLYLLHKNWDSIKEAFETGLNAIKAKFDAVKETVLGWVDTISNAWDKVKGFFGSDEQRGTTGGLNHIGPLGGDAGQAISPASVSNSASTYTSDTSVNIGKVEVTTAATDAEGISRDIGRGLQNNMPQFTVGQSNTGVRQ